MSIFWTLPARRLPPRVLAGSLFLVLALVACSKNTSDRNLIRPITSVLEISAGAPAQSVFLQKNAADTSSQDDVNIVDVMLRMNPAQPMDAFTLELAFDPGILQIAPVDWSGTPLGDCANPAGQACTLLCANNVAPGGPVPPANATGDLLIGVSQTPMGCAAVTPPAGDVKLLTITFIAASAGTSPIHLISGATHGDCEILNTVAGAPTDLMIPCFDGSAPLNAAARVTAGR